MGQVGAQRPAQQEALGGQLGVVCRCGTGSRAGGAGRCGLCWWVGGWVALLLPSTLVKARYAKQMGHMHMHSHMPQACWILPPAALRAASCQEGY